jgi:hypothetical protein
MATVHFCFDPFSSQKNSLLFWGSISLTARVLLNLLLFQVSLSFNCLICFLRWVRALEHNLFFYCFVTYEGSFKLILFFRFLFYFYMLLVMVGALEHNWSLCDPLWVSLSRPFPLFWVLCLMELTKVSSLLCTFRSFLFFSLSSCQNKPWKNILHWINP